MIPKPALSIRQPWAWLIVNGFKDVENRTWPTKFRGPVLIHAGATMTRADYEACVLFLAGIHQQLPDRGWRLPAPDVLRAMCGGIVGQARITGCVTQSNSPWFVGEYGFTLTEQQPLEFEPCKGALGFFKPVLTVPTARPGYRRSFIGEPKELAL